MTDYQAIGIAMIGFPLISFGMILASNRIADFWSKEDLKKVAFGYFAGAYLAATAWFLT